MTAAASEVTVTPEEILRSKRAVVVLMECLKAAYYGKEPPKELRRDVHALTVLIRKAEKLSEKPQNGLE